MQVISIRRISSYTSLKDLLPELAPPCSCCSWREIPIKDPLLQHAAWAYLQPMGMMLESDKLGNRWWRRLQDKLCRMLGCFNDVVLVLFQWWFTSEMEMARVDISNRT